MFNLQATCFSAYFVCVNGDPIFYVWVPISTTNPIGWEQFNAPKYWYWQFLLVIPDCVRLDFCC